MQKPQLFLLHFAGGNCYSFQFMTSLLNSFQAIPLELPGRGKRIGEPLLKDFDLAAGDIYDQITRRLISVPFLIYGHSLGAYLALRVAGMLERSGRHPVHVIVSGNAGPDIGEDKRRTYELGKESFIKELKRLGGIPAELIENAELFDFFDPILRADFEVAENNGMGDKHAINSPIYAMMGSREERGKDIANWARFTRGRFRHEILEGDHFFIHNHSLRIAKVIWDCFEHSALINEKK